MAPFTKMNPTSNLLNTYLWNVLIYHLRYCHAIFQYNKYIIRSCAPFSKVNFASNLLNTMECINLLIKILLCNISS